MKNKQFLRKNFEEKQSGFQNYFDNKGLKNFRCDHDNALRGFGIGDLDPIDKLNLEKKLRLSDKLITITKDKKFFRKMYERIAFLYHGMNLKQKLESKYIFAKYYGIASNAKPIEEISDNLIGNPKNVLKVNGNSYTFSLLRFYLLYAQSCRIIDWEKIDSMVEIGGGFGMQSEIIKRLHPHIENILLDLPEQGKLQEKYLKATLPNFEKVKIIQTDELGEQNFDVLWNSMSFERMNTKFVDYYLEDANKNAKKFVCLHNTMKIINEFGFNKENYIESLSNFDLIYDEPSIGQFLETHHNLTCAIFKQKNK
ncbi:MAG: putative sugar O-methyltransferase [Hydrogenophilales bacterium]